MKAKLFTSEGAEKGTVDLPDAVFNAAVNEQCLRQVILAYLANRRQGTSKTKTRAEVRGSGTKPWRQKGTGRARAGSNASPIWVRGGKAFGPVPRDYTMKISRSMKKKALRSALASRAREEKIFVMESMACESPRTRTVARLLASMQCGGSRNLMILSHDDRAVYLSGRNIKNLNIKPVADINAYDVMKSEHVIFTDTSIVEKMSEVVAP